MHPNKIAEEHQIGQENSRILGRNVNNLCLIHKV